MQERSCKRRGEGTEGWLVRRARPGLHGAPPPGETANNRTQTLLSPAGDLGEQTESQTCQSKGWDDAAKAPRDSRVELWTPTRGSMAKTESPAAAGGENGQSAMQVREGHASEDGGGGRGREPRGKEGVRRRLGWRGPDTQQQERGQTGSPAKRTSSEMKRKKKIRFQAVLLVNLKIKQQN